MFGVGMMLGLSGLIQSAKVRPLNPKVRGSFHTLTDNVLIEAKLAI